MTKLWLKLNDKLWLFLRSSSLCIHTNFVMDGLRSVVPPWGDGILVMAMGTPKQVGGKQPGATEKFAAKAMAVNRGAAASTLKMRQMHGFHISALDEDERQQPIPEPKQEQVVVEPPMNKVLSLMDYLTQKPKAKAKPIQPAFPPPESVIQSHREKRVIRLVDLVVQPTQAPPLEPVPPAFPPPPSAMKRSSKDRWVGWTSC